MSQRGLTTAFRAELAEQSVREIIMLRLELDSGILALFNGTGEVRYLGDDYIGAGNFLSISNLEETLDNRAVGASLALSLDPSIISLVLNEAKNSQGRPARIYVGLLNEQWSLINSPTQYDYLIDNMQILDDGESGQVRVNLEGREIRDQIVKESRYTDAEQVIDFPTDRAFLGTPKIANRPVYWGNVRTT